MLVLQWVQLFSEVDLYLSVVQLAVLGSPVFPHLHRAIGGQILHPEAHLLGKLHGIILEYTMDSFDLVCHSDE